MKKEEFNYFDAFEKSGEYALQISEILKEYIENFNCEECLEKEAKVHELENLADENLHKTLKYLVKDFLPPIEREDIVNLSHRVDTVVDCLDEVVINLDILDIQRPRPDVIEMVNLIYNACTKTKEMLSKFKNLKKYEEIIKLVVDINSIESDGDVLFQNAIRNLYKKEKNAIEISKWDIIYNSLEECFDACENVANCVEEIIMKIS